MTNIDLENDHYLKQAKAKGLVHEAMDSEEIMKVRAQMKTDMFHDMYSCSPLTIHDKDTRPEEVKRAERKKFSKLYKSMEPQLHNKLFKDILKQHTQ